MLRWVLALVFSTCLFAQKQPTLSDLAWLEGHWSGPSEDRVNEEWFSAPAGGTIAGIFRMTRGGKTLILEVGTIAEESGEILLRQRSFGPQMQAFGDTVLTLHLKSWDGKTAEFVNPLHTKPKRTLLIREAPDTLAVRSEIVWDDGKEEVHALKMQRVK